MSHVAAKGGFKTINQKFAHGAPVDPSEIDPSNALTFDQLQKRGFIVEKNPKHKPAHEKA